MIAIVCVLDTLNLAFGMNLLYCYIRELLGDIQATSRVLWSLKALATTQVFLILFVHLYYLRQMWLFSSNSILLSKRYRIAAQIFVITVGIFAIAVAAIFLGYLPRIDVVYGFSPGFEYIIYLAFGTVAVVDCSIAAAMCVILYKCSSWIVVGISRSESVLESLIQYFVGTGLLTSFSAIMVIILYVARTHTLLYLVIEFSVTRLYANSILAMFNARHTLAERMNQTIDVRMPHGLLSKEPESTGTRFGWHGHLATSPTSATRYSPAGDSSRYTPGAGSHKQEASGEGKLGEGHEGEALAISVA